MRHHRSNHWRIKIGSRRRNFRILRRVRSRPNRRIVGNPFKRTAQEMSVMPEDGGQESHTLPVLPIHLIGRGSVKTSREGLPMKIHYLFLIFAVLLTGCETTKTALDTPSGNPEVMFDTDDLDAVKSAIFQIYIADGWDSRINER